MQSYCLEPTEDMAPLRQEHKDWIIEQIQLEIREHLTPYGWKKLQQLLPLAAVIGIFIALLGLAGAGWNNAFSRLEKETRFQTQTTDTLVQINGSITGLRESLTLLQAQFAAQKYSTIPLKELKPHRDELAGVKKSLASIPQEIPNFWPTAFKIIELLSQSSFADFDKIAAQQESQIVSTTSNPPGGIGTAPNTRFFLKGHVEGLTFKHSIIRFDPDVELVNDVFIDCAFILPIQGNPSKPIIEIGRTLLASDLSKVTLNAS
jgi:hypothetical protein